VSASTQNQALAALLFLYREIFGRDPGWLEGVVRAKRPRRLPVILTRPEVSALLGALHGVSWIMAMLLYGAGRRLRECLRLRMKDIDFDRNEIVVREGKGNKDRVTMLPVSVKEPLATHLERVRRLHERDLTAGFGRVQLPDALPGNTPPPTATGVGSGSSRPRRSAATRVLASRSGTTSTSRYCKRPFMQLPGRRQL
jgi:integrase